MKRMYIICLITLPIILLLQMNVYSQYTDRSDIPVQFTWNLEDLYPSDESWERAKEELISQLDEIDTHKGKLASSASNLLACLQLDSRLSKTFYRLYSYASMKSDEDTRNSKYLSMKQEMIQIGTDFNSKASFIEPEIVSMDNKIIDQFLTQESELQDYKMFLFDIQRRKAHKLSEKEEKILAEAGLMASSPYSIYRVFANAELPFPEISLSDGQSVIINQANYTLHRAAQNRRDREIVFHNFWSAFNSFRGTIGEQLYANIKKDMFYARTRNYQSSLESALDVNNIPTDVYLALIDNVNSNLDSFHRYLRLKKRMLGVDTLKYSDLYAPVVEGVDLEYSVVEAQSLILDAMDILGRRYQDVISTAFDNRWIDMYPTPGKQSGAYSNGNAYDLHPYILMNYNGKYEDVSTLAHELGHALHSYYANKTQPFPLADYSIFVAEVASTFNEALLHHAVLKSITDNDIRLSLLMSYLDGLKGTVFRQTQFAEFELRIHELAESGKPLTGDVLTEEYGNILKKYYGHDQGICHIDDLYTVEWAYIPHFYYNFYVYQYATSFTASTALAEQVLNNERGAVDNYIEFISAGGSDYPIPLLKKAGVDMTTSGPFEKTMTAMNRTIDEIETILNNQ